MEKRDPDSPTKMSSLLNSGWLNSPARKSSGGPTVNVVQEKVLTPASEILAKTQNMMAYLLQGAARRGASQESSGYSVYKEADDILTTVITIVRNTIGIGSQVTASTQIKADDQIKAKEADEVSDDYRSNLSMK